MRETGDLSSGARRDWLCLCPDLTLRTDWTSFLQAVQRRGLYPKGRLAVKGRRDIHKLSVAAVPHQYEVPTIEEVVILDEN